MYLYTKAIEFAPYGSDEHRKSRSAEIVTPSDDRVPRPSPKSIYRLADKVCTLFFTVYLGYPISDKPSPQYDVPALRTLALDHIRAGVANCDIVEETFSRFASQ